MGVLNDEQGVNECPAGVLALVDQQKRELLDEHALHERLREQERREYLDDFAVVQRITFPIVASGIVGEGLDVGEPLQPTLIRIDLSLTGDRRLGARPAFPSSA